MIARSKTALYLILDPDPTHPDEIVLKQVNIFNYYYFIINGIRSEYPVSIHSPAFTLLQSMSHWLIIVLCNMSKKSCPIFIVN